MSPVVVAKNCGGTSLFDHRSTAHVDGQSLQDWLVHNLTVSPTGVLHPDINGLYIDDGIRSRLSPGSAPFGDMRADVVADMGLDANDIKQLSAAWEANIHEIEKATTKAGGFLVQMFTDGNRVLSRANCEQFLRKAVRCLWI